MFPVIPTGLPRLYLDNNTSVVPPATYSNSTLLALNSTLLSSVPATSNLLKLNIASIEFYIAFSPPATYSNLTILFTFVIKELLYIVPSFLYHLILLLLLLIIIIINVNSQLSLHDLASMVHKHCVQEPIKVSRSHSFQDLFKATKPSIQLLTCLCIECSLIILSAM